MDTTIPHLVYHETSAESVIETKHLLSAGLVDPALCCILVDSFAEYRHIQDMIHVGDVRVCVRLSACLPACSCASTRSVVFIHRPRRVVRTVASVDSAFVAWMSYAW